MDTAGSLTVVQSLLPGDDHAVGVVEEDLRHAVVEHGVDHLVELFAAMRPRIHGRLTPGRQHPQELHEVALARAGGRRVDDQRRQRFERRAQDNAEHGRQRHRFAHRHDPRRGVGEADLADQFAQRASAASASSRVGSAGTSTAMSVNR